MEIRDIDNYTTQDKVEAALDQDLKESKGEIKVHMTEPNVGVQRMTIVEMDEQGVNKLLKTTRIKIGLINSRVRRHILLP